MSNPYEPSSDPWSDPARATAPPAPPRDALAEAPSTAVPDFQAPPPPQAPQYPPAQYPPPHYPPPHYPPPQYPPPQYPAVQYPAPPQPGGPQYPPPQYPGTPPYVPAPPYPGQPGYPYGYQGWPVPAPQKPKSRVGLIVGIVVGVVVLCLAGAATLVVIGLNKAEQLAGPAHVVAEVTGSGPTQLTFMIGNEIVETGTKPMPYSITRDIARGASRSHISLVARPTAPGGSASCRILIDGTVAASHSASGFNTQAACDAYV